MPCYARWVVDNNSGLFFRDQTILQFGNSWELLANFILLNPGKALPKNDVQQNEFLETKSLNFFINNKDLFYYEFTVDPLMRDLLKLYASRYSGGVIKIYNLFNLKNQDSKSAIEQYKIHKSIPYMHTDIDEIKYCGAPVIIATGQDFLFEITLISEFKKYLSLIDSNQLYSIEKVKYKTYAVVKTTLKQNGIVESYHPSFTFNYGNTTLLDIIR